MSYVDPIHLPYHGVLIERPCTHCDTVDMHYEGECSQGPCQKCGRKRGEHYWLTEDEHDWQPARYDPALIANAPGSFDAIIDEAGALGWPAHFSSDLYRDYQALRGLGLWKNRAVPERFVWVVRDTGTDLITVETQGQTARLLVERNRRHYVWDGDHLHAVRPQAALEMHSVWRRQAQAVA